LSTPARLLEPARWSRSNPMDLAVGCYRYSASELPRSWRGRASAGMGLPWTGVCPPDRVVPDGQARPRPMPWQSPGSRLLGARSPLAGGCWRSALPVAARTGVWRWATARGRGRGRGW
jgi:hypothetical protein